MSNIVFAPASEAQSQFLLSDAFFTLYGGAAFAGKSMCLLGSVLPICHHPGTRALCIRKTTKQLTGAGSLFDAAIQLFMKVDPKLKIRTRDMILQFSSGAILQFTYLDNPKDKLNLQGKEYSHLMLDEVQQLSFDNVIYAMSRVRSTIVDYPLRVVATANPDYDCWLREWVEFALDERGIPIRKDVYPSRYFVNQSNKITWYDSLEEANSIHGTGKDNGVKSFKFVPGSIYDNPIGLELNKDYISTLKALPRVEMERLLLGSWYARESTSGVFKREWCTEVIYSNPRAIKRVRAWDLAATLPSESNRDPDWTAGVLMSREKTGVVTVEDMLRIRNRPHVVKELIFETAKRDGKDTIVVVPLDPGATAGAYCRQIQRELIEMGFTCKLVRPDKSKMQRFRPFAAIAEAGFVCVVEADWNSDFYTELEQFTGNKSAGHDDQCDVCSDAFYILTKENVLPDFHLPDFTSAPAFSFN